jgi:excisionase family DNA binding protein
MGEISRALSTNEAAAFLGVSPRTLEDWRCRGGGPIFHKVGRRLVRYCLASLEAYLEAGARLNTSGGVPT